jgi:hypothetical protein
MPLRVDASLRTSLPDVNFRITSIRLILLTL